ncbi:MAG: transcriptional initiation protein Tat, partial [Methylobacterium organophilum]|nr:transcriptional initiation protein Tat [Methylobacterium organophilum]
MTFKTGRRGALQILGLAAGAAGGTALTPAAARAASPDKPPLVEAGAGDLRALMERLAKAPRRRDFKTVPMILTKPEEWDHEALTEVMAYRP